MRNAAKVNRVGTEKVKRRLLNSTLMEAAQMKTPAAAAMVTVMMTRIGSNEEMLIIDYR